MKQIRRGVFETNSSSTHSITIRQADKKFPAHIHVEKDGYVYVEFGEYGWEIADYTTANSKLDYLLTMARILTGCNENYWDDEFEYDKDIEAFLRTPEFIYIEDVVKKHSGCKGIKFIRSNAYIDHQSIEDYTTLNDFLNEYSMTVERFIFDPDVVMHTDNDN